MKKVLTWFVELGKEFFGSRLSVRRSALQKVRRHQYSNYSDNSCHFDAEDT
jgi:hypothetical protein